MSPPSDDHTATVSCPECGSETIERLSVGHDADYRCLDCGAEFNDDDDGTRAVLP